MRCGGLVRDYRLEDSDGGGGSGGDCGGGIVSRFPLTTHSSAHIKSIFSFWLFVCFSIC